MLSQTQSVARSALLWLGSIEARIKAEPAPDVHKKANLKAYVSVLRQLPWLMRKHGARLVLDFLAKRTQSTESRAQPARDVLAFLSQHLTLADASSPVPQPAAQLLSNRRGRCLASALKRFGDVALNPDFTGDPTLRCENAAAEAAIYRLPVPRPGPRPDASVVRNARYMLDYGFSPADASGDAKSVFLDRHVFSCHCPAPYRRAFERRSDDAESLKAKGLSVERFGHGAHSIALRLNPAQPRLFTGKGQASVLELGISLDHFGMPFIAKSALKGIARRAAGCAQIDDEETKRKYIARVFGDESTGNVHPGEAGTVDFWDARYVPDTAPEDRPLAKDGITVHHGPYYDSSGDNPPDGRNDPTPAPLVAAQGQFDFVIVSADSDDAKFARQCLVHALTTTGAGATTGAGYGFFVPA